MGTVKKSIPFVYYVYEIKAIAVSRVDMYFKSYR
jgi:hypothetical protein